MAIDTKDILGWIITGGIGSAGLILNLLSRRDAKKKAKREAEAIWSLHREHGKARDARGQFFKINLTDYRTNRFRISDMKVVEPKGALIARIDHDTKRDVNKGRYPAEFRDRLVFDQDVVSGYVPGGAAEPTNGSIWFFADWPSATARKNRSRLVVVINVEEMYSSRRESRVKIRSQPIDWKVSATASAT